MSCESRKRWTKPGAKAVFLVNGALLMLLAYFAWTTVYSSDDYWYSTFWDQGLMHYLELMEYHYQVFNGRVLVHVLAHIVLHFGRWAFVLMCCGLCVLGSWIVAGASGGSEDRFQVVLCAMLMGIFCMPLGMFNQGLMWISASCNYLFPVILACGLALLLQRQSRWAPLMAFLCGATTEQMGIAAVVMCVAYLIRGILRRNGILHGIGCTALASVGVFTIFHSPATQNRTEDVLWDGLEEFLEILRKSIIQEKNLLIKNPAPVFIMVLVLVLGAVLLWRMYGLKWPVFPAALGGAALLVGSMSAHEAGYVGFVIGFFALAVLGAILMKHDIGIGGVLILAALTAAAVMLPTSTIEPRVMMPVYMLFLLACCSLVAMLRPKLELFRWLAVTALIPVLMMTGSTISGYWYNYQIDEANKAYAREAAGKSYIRYCTDYDMDYTWIKADNKEYFQEKYVESLGFPESFPVRYFSNFIQSTPILCGDTEIVRLSIAQEDGKVIFPLREIVEAVGGSLEWYERRMVVVIQGTEYELWVPDDDVVTITWTDETGVSREYSGLRALLNWTTYCEESVFTQAFGLKVRLDGDSGYYIVEP